MNYFTPKGDPFLFNCPCGECDVAPSKQLISLLNKARRSAGIPFVVTSGPRCPSHNTDVGGAPGSDHLTFEAADVSCLSSTQRFAIVQAGLEAGFTRIGIGKTFVHLGFGTNSIQRVIWLY